MMNVFLKTLMPRQPRIKQQGISLVSLMISMALSVFLMFVLLQVFNSTKGNYKLTRNLVEMNDSMRFIVNAMSNIISHAGYRTPTASSAQLPSFATAFPQLAHSNFSWSSADGEYIIPNYNANYGEQIIVAFQGNDDGRIKDCRGNTVLGGDTAHVIFSPDPYGTSGTGMSLICSRIDSYVAGTTEDTYMMSNILDGFWVRYGEDIDNNGYVDRYLESGLDPNKMRIRSVRVAIMVRSRDEVFGQSVEQKFSLWGNLLTKDSRYLFKLHTFTVPLKNLPNPLP